MLLSCVAGAMRRYLADKGDRTEGVECRALAPIDLRQPGDTELGNRFGIIVVELPVGVEHPLERLMTVRQRMLALKTSYEPATTLGLFAALGYLPKIVQHQLLDLLASRANPDISALVTVAVASCGRDQARLAQTIRQTCSFGDAMVRKLVSEIAGR